MTPHAAEIRAWTYRNWLARLAYLAQPISSNQGGHLPCLRACGRSVRGNAAYCSTCQRRTRP